MSHMHMNAPLQLTVQPDGSKLNDDQARKLRAHDDMVKTPEYFELCLAAAPQRARDLLPYGLLDEVRICIAKAKGQA